MAVSMLAKRNQYLREMGIDVWVLRDGRRAEAPAASEPAPEAQSSPAPVDPPSTPRRVRAPVAPPPEFHLCFATYGNLSLIFSVPQSAKSLPDELQRFANDIARALGRKNKPVVNALRWPLVQSADFDQSEQSARTVIGQRLAGCGELRLIFGEETASWVRQANELVLAEISTYLENPITKRELWQVLWKVSS